MPLQQKRHYSIRKLQAGVGSVLIGTSLLVSLSTQAVYAEEPIPATGTPLAAQQPADTTVDPNNTDTQSAPKTDQTAPVAAPEKSAPQAEAKSPATPVTAPIITDLEKLLNEVEELPSLQPTDYFKNQIALWKDQGPIAAARLRIAKAGENKEEVNKFLGDYIQYATIEKMARHAQHLYMLHDEDEQMLAAIKEAFGIGEDGDTYASMEGRELVAYVNQTVRPNYQKVLDLARELDAKKNAQTAPQVPETKAPETPQEPKDQPQTPPVAPETEEKKETPQPQTPPAVETPQQPQVEQQPKTETSPQTGDAPKAENTPKVETTPKVENSPKVEASPKTETTPKTKNTPKAETTPKTESKPKTETTPKAENTPKVEATPKTENAPKVETTPKANKLPKADAAPKSDTKQPNTLKKTDKPSPLDRQNTPKDKAPSDGQGASKTQEQSEKRPENKPTVPAATLTPVTTKSQQRPTLPKTGEASSLLTWLGAGLISFLGLAHSKKKDDQ